MIAPKKGPKIIPSGEKNSVPTMVPIKLPHAPNFEPPYFLVPQLGMRKSKTCITITTSNQTPKKVYENVVI